MKDENGNLIYAGNGNELNSLVPDENGEYFVEKMKKIMGGQPMVSSEISPSDELFEEDLDNITAGIPTEEQHKIR